MPAAPRTNKTVKVQALVNLSLSRPEKQPDGTSYPRTHLVRKGTVLDLTDAEVANFGRLVRVIDDEHEPLSKVPATTLSKLIGVTDVNKMGKPNLKGTGALDISESTRVSQSEAQTDWDAQPEG